MLHTVLNGCLVEVCDLTRSGCSTSAPSPSRERRAGRAKLRVAAQWCVLHPATDESGFVTWSDTGLPVLCPDEEAAVGGEGTPLVAAFTPEPFAVALGCPPLTGLQLLADALDLQHRLPRIWKAVEALAVSPWKARNITQATYNLSLAAAASVDRQSHIGAGRVGGGRSVSRSLRRSPPMIRTCSRPGRSRARMRGGCRSAPRRLHRRCRHWVGTSYLEVTGDTLDLTTFHDLVCEQAAQLKALVTPTPSRSARPRPSA